MADHVVVRGTFHKQILDDQEIPCSVIQDGVETDLFAPRDERDFRRRIGVVDEVTIGLIGSSSWSPRLQICYGWELVEVLRLLKDKRIKGIMVGDGSGIEILRQRAREYGIEDKMIFLGRLALERLPEALGAMDICLSTQTNNIAGRVRTTGKLPIYMAAGRFILASRVGEASLVLPDEMLVDFTGERDPEYPAKIAERVCEILKKPSMLQMGGGNIDIARARFDYRLLAARLGDIIDHVLRGTLPARGEVPFEKRR
jgi:glycosyltransferase involved in cell wall biosynthesis